MRQIALALLGLLALGNSASASIVVTALGINTYVINQSEHSDAGSVKTNLLDTAATASMPGYLSSITSNRSTAGNGASFTSNVSQTRLGNELDFARGLIGIDFISDVDVPFQISGSFTNSAGYTDFLVRLHDNDLGQDLFLRYEYGYRSDGPFTYNVDGSATLGSEYTGGSGTLSGILQANHHYSWFVDTATRAQVLGNPLTGVEDDGATASGSVSLVLGDAIDGTVPEPTSVIVWSVLGIACVVAYRARKAV